MGEEEYKSNSHKLKENPTNQIQEKRLESVVSGNAKTKKKSEIHKFTDIFLAEDVGSVKSYILMDVLVPALKKAVTDIITGGINMLLYGDSGSKKSSSSRVTYASYYDKRDTPTTYYNRSPSSTDYDDIIFETRGDAESVLNAMDEIISSYGVVSVGDYYDLSNVSTTNYTVNKYGWTNIRSAQVVRVRDGYLIKLPKAMPIN